MATIQVGAAVPCSRGQLTVHYGETWYYEFPQMVQADSGDPFDLTSVLIEVFMRPSASHTTQFHRMSTVPGPNGGIQMINAAKGLAAILATPGFAELHFPLSLQNGWWHMQRLSYTHATWGPIKRILVEGPFYVLPSRDT
jgi:hypothetical protein